MEGWEREQIHSCKRASKFESGCRRHAKQKRKEYARKPIIVELNRLEEEEEEEAEALRGGRTRSCWLRSRSWVSCFHSASHAAWSLSACAFVLQVSAIAWPLPHPPLCHTLTHTHPRTHSNACTHKHTHTSTRYWNQACAGGGRAGVRAGGAHGSGDRLFKRYGISEDRMI